MRKSYSVSEQEDSSSEKVLSHPNSEQHSLLRAVRKMRPRRASLQDCVDVTKGMDSRSLRGKFKGCLAGSLVGDCIGSLFECDYSVSYSILGDLYKSLTNLSEDEILMDKHGIDFSLPPKKAQELLERKQRSSMISRPSNEENDMFGSSEQIRHSLLEKRRGSFSRPIEKYSDDTVQTKSVAISLIQSGGLDQRNLAKQLTEDYFLNLKRKYGAFSREIFTQLRDSKYSDPTGPAKRGMSNIGSGGNEAASRVAPVALFTWHEEPSIVVDWATKMARITNYNKSGVLGAVCQALAVHFAFKWNFPEYDSEQSTLSRLFRRNTPSPVPSPSTARKIFRAEECIPLQNRASPPEFDSNEFCLRILEIIEHLETRSSSILDNFKQLVHPNRETPKQDSYSEKLRTIMEFLSRSDPPSREEVVQRLGNGFKAIESVPTAIYAFLISMKSENLPEITVKIKSPVLRTIFYAISLGGDSDSIAAMAGAIAGSYWGLVEVPQEILRVCEGSRDLVRLGDELYDMCNRVPMRS